MQENKPRDLNGNVIEKVKDVKGNIIYIDKIIGQGGQGMVCRSLDKNLAVKFVTKGDKVIVNEKVYNSFKEKVEDVSIIRVEDDIHLCKPEVMLEKPMCGYVMLLLNGLKPVSNLIYDANNDSDSFGDFYKQTGGLRKRLEVLIELSRTIARLHSKGIVYCDISPNNAFYADGNIYSNVWLIDCDNLKLSYEAKKGIFTPEYGAPEVVNQISSNTIFSDCFSFAVLAFRLLTAKKPFEVDYSDSSSDGWDATTATDDSYLQKTGKWIVEEDESIKEKYLKHFITRDLFELFDSTFNETGRNVPSSRPSMLKWYEELKRTYIRITRCSCGQFTLSSEDKCPFCDSKINKTQLFTLFNANMGFEKAIEDMKSEAKKDNSDEDFYINESQIKELKSKVHFEKEYDAIFYNDFTLYNFNFNMISIDEIPSSVLYFSESNDSLFITNKTNIKFLYKTGKSQNFQFLPENLKVSKGEKVLIVQLAENKKDIIKYLNIRYE